MAPRPRRAALLLTSDFCPLFSSPFPLQFVTRERITRAQQMMRESKRSLIEIAFEVGYTSPSAFAQVFRRIAGVTPTEVRSDGSSTPLGSKRTSLASFGMIT